MAETTLQAPTPVIAKKKTSENAFMRVAKYMAVRLLTLAVTVVIGLYLTILFANMGGYVDQIRRGDIRETIQSATLNDPNLKTMTSEQRTKILEERIGSR